MGSGKSTLKTNERINQPSRIQNGSRPTRPNQLNQQRSMHPPMHQQTFMHMQTSVFQGPLNSTMMNSSRFPMPPMQIPMQMPLPIKPQSNVVVMQNDILLKKSSARITNSSESSEQGSPSLNLEFEFDALKPVTITVLFFVMQKIQFFTQLHDSFEQEKSQATFQSSACTRGQKFTTPLPKGVQDLPASFLETKDRFWPIIIRMERTGEQEKKSLFSYFSIERKNNKDLIPILRKQVLEFNMESFEIQEIYGVENTDLVHGEAANSAQEQKQANMDDCNKECIICMTDLIDTVIMPCRHMCICLECAKSLQQKKTQQLCPVCRKEIQSFLRISKQQQQPQTQQQELPKGQAPSLLQQQQTQFMQSQQ